MTCGAPSASLHHRFCRRQPVVLLQRDLAGCNQPMGNASSRKLRSRCRRRSTGMVSRPRLTAARCALAVTPAWRRMEAASTRPSQGACWRTLKTFQASSATLPAARAAGRAPAAAPRAILPAARPRPVEIVDEQISFPSAGATGSRRLFNGPHRVRPAPRRWRRTRRRTTDVAIAFVPSPCRPIDIRIRGNLYRAIRSRGCCRRAGDEVAAAETAQAGGRQTRRLRIDAPPRFQDVGGDGQFVSRCADILCRVVQHEVLEMDEFATDVVLHSIGFFLTFCGGNFGQAAACVP